MSITFWAPDAPTTKFTPYPEDEPDYVEEVSTLPELNISEANAPAFLRLIGVTPDYCGTFEVAEMSTLISRLTVLANKASSREPLVREPDNSVNTAKWNTEGNVTTVSRGPRVIDCGVSDERVQRYALTLLNLLTQARQANYRVSWG